MTDRIRMLGLALCAASAWLGGCSVSRPRDYTLDIAATTGMLAVDIENFRGSVEVRTDHRVQQAVVSAKASAHVSMGDQSVAAIDEIWIDADLVEEGARGVLTIRTGSPRENMGDHWVSLYVSVPRCEGLRVVNTGGVVEVVGTSGGTTITNHLGSVEFRTAKPMTDPVAITTTDGEIYYQVPAGSTGRFDMATLEGRVWYRDRVQGTDNSYAAPGLHTARLNGGSNPVALRTNRGNINVWVDEEPTELTRIIKHDAPDIQDYWFLQGSRRHTRNLSEDHPEVARTQATENPYHDGY